MVLTTTPGMAIGLGIHSWILRQGITSVGKNFGHLLMSCMNEGVKVVAVTNVSGICQHCPR